MTADAVKAEEVLAELEASAELAGSVGSVGASGMTEEEQALYEELETRGRRAKKPPSATGSSNRSAVAPAARGRHRLAETVRNR